MALKSCKGFFAVKFRTVFRLFRHRVNASSNSATVKLFTVFKMCRHRVKAVLDPEIMKMLPRSYLGTRIPHSILEYNLLAIEIKVLFLRLTM